MPVTLRTIPSNKWGFRFKGRLLAAVRNLSGVFASLRHFIMTELLFRRFRRRDLPARSAVASTKFYAAETGGALSGFRIAAITSGRKISSRGAAGFCPAFG